ncbi:MAG: AAA family ATPase [Desulfobacteraceae bacterium]|jgi:MoxR-like ATPase
MSQLITVPSEPVPLPESGSWPATRHEFDEKSIWAILAAVKAKRPLLVRGEPGTGKSQLARAAAVYLRRAFIFEVVHARSECHDLQYHFDAVARLGEAQTLSVLKKSNEKVEDLLAPKRFITPGALWWAFDWSGAEDQYEIGNKAARRPERPTKWCPQWQPDNGTALLIDEIDKADADLPNGLLETMGNGAFAVPYMDNPVRMDKKAPPPLVVITTNEERELPVAFIRRCLVLHLKLKEDPQELIQWLCRRGEVHFGKACGDVVRKEAAEQLVEDRIAAKKLNLPVPGQAEYLDMLRAVIGIAKDNKEEQLNVLKFIRDFALSKYTDDYR